MSKLTKEEVLHAVIAAPHPDSIYIASAIYRQHTKKADGTPYPLQSLILARLQSLAADGLLIQSEFTNGYYGYRWELTPLGRSALTNGGGNGE